MKLAVGATVVLWTAMSAAPGFGAEKPPVIATVPDVRAQADDLSQAIVARMTLEEKFPQLLNVAPAIPRLGIPAYNWWTESLHGALGPLPTTNFPEPIGLAASFDTQLTHDVASVISVEVRGLHTLGRQTGRLGRIGTGLDTWSPNINIFRDPRWGRGQETYGEDPFLTAQMGVAFITGMQGNNPDKPDVIATPKHFAVHSGPESIRHGANVFLSTHDLEDTYLPAFRAAIVEAHAGSIMCAYNRVDGQPACASDLLLKDHLRGAWGFQGYVVSDCDAVQDIADNHHYAPDPAAAVATALKAGVDNECNTATLGNVGGKERRYRDALERGLLSTGDIDRALVRLFSARIRNGDLPGLAKTSARVVAPDRIGSPENEALARKAATESLVLLKNDGVLPLKPGLKIAVIGPLGDATRVLRGNYSSPLSVAPISVVDGLRQVLPVADVTLVPFSASLTDGDRVPGAALLTPEGQRGVRVSYFNPVTSVPDLIDPVVLKSTLASIRYPDKPVVSRVESDVGDRVTSLPEVGTHHRTDWSGFVVPPESGTYRIGLTGVGGILRFDGVVASDRTKARYNDLATFVTVPLVADHRYRFDITSEGNADLVWKRVSPTPVVDVVKAAATANILVAVVGLTSDLEAEETSISVPGFQGGDKTTLDLPADQIALLSAAKATGKPVIVVAMNGSPINLSWAKENASAILETWYPGQSGGRAIADVLTGRANPGGRLPLTFYRSVADLPPFGDYSMAGRTYRYFNGIPVYPFGFGLSFTRFAYAPIKFKIDRTSREPAVDVTTEVTNAGDRSGDEVVQLYLQFPDHLGAPHLALRGFQRVNLMPHEKKPIFFHLSARDLSAVNVDGLRSVLAGKYRLSVGSGQPAPDVPGQSTSFSMTKNFELPR